MLCSFVNLHIDKLLLVFCRFGTRIRSRSSVGYVHNCVTLAIENILILTTCADINMMLVLTYS
jgi:hypothetical protein